MQKTYHKIINGDNRDMSELRDETIHLVVTSPPYWQLKDYGTENQIGFHDDYETYINHLNLTWAECYRVLHKGCRLCINIGDQFARSVYYGRYKIIPIHTEIIKFCEYIGFDFMGAIIWQKSTTMNTSGGGSVMGSFPYPRNGIVKMDFEYILLFKKQGDAPKPDPIRKAESEMTKEEWNTYFNGHWHFGGARQDGHIAVFPEELPKRLIKMFSFAGENVLDPFMGSGTTASVARKLGRNSYGYEINAEFIPLIKQKLGVSTENIFDDIRVDFITQTAIDTDFSARIADLPYRFVDTHKLDKKIDIKKLQFGSVIDKNSSAERESFYSVKEIISPELVRLNNDLVVRLLGIKQDASKTDEAIAFLERKTKKQKVFLKYDAQKHDEDNHLLVYLYLQNKTFLNAHLLKNKLAFVSDQYEFKYKRKFEQLLIDKNVSS